MPLSETTGRVTASFEQFGECDLFRVQTSLLAGKHDAAVHADAMSVRARHEGGTGRSASRIGDVELSQHVSFPSHSVEVGSPVDLVAERTDIAVAHVINKDEDNVRLLDRGSGIGENRQSDRRQDELS